MMKKGCVQANPSKVPGKLNTGHIRVNPNSSGSGKKAAKPAKGGRY